MWWKTAKLVFDTLLEAESCLQVLDLSENNVRLLYNYMILFIACGFYITILKFQIAGWLSHFKWGSRSCVNTDRQINKSLKSLRLLNLRYLKCHCHLYDITWPILYLRIIIFVCRCNNLQKDDADCLKYAMVYMPNLEVLNLSENPLQDEGIRSVHFYVFNR